MTWVHAKRAAFSALTALVRRVMPRIGNGAASRGLAQSIARKLKRRGKPTLTEAALSVRAHRLHNRNATRAAMYLERHKTLTKGVLNYE